MASQTRQKGKVNFTLIGHWQLGTFIAVLPLITAVGYALWSMNVQTMQEAALLRQVVTITGQGKSIVDQLAELERLSRRYYSTKALPIAVDYRSEHSRFQDSIRSLASVLNNEAIAAKSEQLIKLTDPRKSGLDSRSVDDTIPISRISVVFGEAAELADEIYRQDIENYVQNSLNERLEAADSIQNLILMIGALVLPLTIILILICTRLVSKPIKLLLSNIKRLGRGQWEEATSVVGPEEFSEIGERLDWLRIQFINQEQQKSTFLRHVTHELKTPLAAIIEASSLIGDEVLGPVAEGQKNALNILQTNAGKLQQMIQQLLALNAIQLAAREPLKEIDVKEFVKNQCVYFAETARKHEISIEATGQPLTALSDPHRLEMIVRNLISNALSFSPPKTKVEITWRKQSRTWCIEIRDSGPGISVEDKETVFKPFQTKKSEQRHGMMGSGLGLTITKECALSLNGDVKVTTTAPQGACFQAEFATP